MRNRGKRRIRPSEAVGQAGFSLVEMLIVVAIIMIMAAVALPNIGQYIRNYKIQGAVREVTAEIQQARAKAIMQNTNAGITFAVVDSNSYRWLSEDAPNRTPADSPYTGVLRDLPMGVRFDTVAGGSTSLRFNRLGAACVPGVSGCAAAFTGTFCSVGEAGRCTEQPYTANPYFNTTDATRTVVTVRETLSGLTRVIVIGPGGRVTTQQQ